MSIKVEFKDGTVRDFYQANDWGWKISIPATLHIYECKKKNVLKEVLSSKLFSRKVITGTKSEPVKTKTEIACILAESVVMVEDTTSPF